MSNSQRRYTNTNTKYRKDKLYKVSACSSVTKFFFMCGLQGPKFLEIILKNKEYLFINMSVVICNKYWIKVKQGKAIPLHDWTGPEGSRKLRLPDFKTIATWRWLGCQPNAPVIFTTTKYSWYLFLLEAESTPGQLCCRKNYVNGKFQWHHWESNPRPSGL